MKDLRLKKYCKVEEQDFVEIGNTQNKRYMVAARTRSPEDDAIFVSPTDFAEMMISGVLDVAKRHPEEYKAALAKFPQLAKKPRWEERPDEEIKAGDWVKCKREIDLECTDPLASCKAGEIIKVVDNDEKRLLLENKMSGGQFLKDGHFPYKGLRYRFVKVVKVD